MHERSHKKILAIAGIGAIATALAVGTYMHIKRQK